MREIKTKMFGFCVKISLFYCQHRTSGQLVMQKRLHIQSYMDIASFLKLLSEVSKSLKMRQLSAPVEGSMSTATHVGPSHENDGPLASILENEVFDEPEARRECSRSPVPERAAASSSRRVSVAEPDAERTPTRRSTRDTTDDLPAQIRDHFIRIRESETPGDDRAQASIAVRSRSKFIAFMVNRVLTKEQVEHQRELKDLPGNLDYRRESPTVQSYIDGSRQKEWKKYEDFQAAVPLKGKELSDLLEAGHVGRKEEGRFRVCGQQFDASGHDFSWM